MSGADRTGLEPFSGAGSRRQVHLLGFMGSGKSTVGRQLARRLVWNFLDLDALVERHAGKSVARIFADDGEAEFRRLESFALRQAVQKPRAVVALGGGTAVDADNWRLTRRSAVSVWLRCPLREIQARLASAGTTRPLWAGSLGVAELFAAREPTYARADYVVDATHAAAEVAAAVEAILRASRSDG